MASKYNGIERYVFADVYNFFLKYKDMNNTDSNWEKCIAEGNLLAFKYKNHPLATSMISSTIVQIEHIVNGRLLRGNSHKEWEELLIASHIIGIN